jgi:hypothetical protein
MTDLASYDYSLEDLGLSSDDYAASIEESIAADRANAASEAASDGARYAEWVAERGDDLDLEGGDDDVRGEL